MLKTPTGVKKSDYNHALSDSLNESTKQLFDLMKQRSERIQDIHNDHSEQYLTIIERDQAIRQAEKNFDAATKPVILSIDRAWRDAESQLKAPSTQADQKDVLTAMNVILGLPDGANITTEAMAAIIAPIMGDVTALRTVVPVIASKGFFSQFAETTGNKILQAVNELETNMNNAREGLERIVTSYRLRQNVDLPLLATKEMFIKTIIESENTKSRIMELMA